MLGSVIAVVTVLVGLQLLFRVSMEPAPLLTTPTSWESLVKAGSHSGKVALVTGGNTGIGFETVRALVHAGMHVVFTSRSAERGSRAQAELNRGLPSPKVAMFAMDLSDIAQTRALARWLKDEYLPSIKTKQLDVVILNAAYNQGGEDYSTNKNGWEMTAAANHFGNFALVEALRAAGVLGASARLVVVTSHLHDVVPSNRARLTLPDDLLWSREKMLSKWPVVNSMEIYANTKTANILWARQLAKQGIFAVSVHPGLIATELGHARVEPGQSLVRQVILTVLERISSAWKHTIPFVKSTAQGAATQVWAALSDEVKPGGYYRDVAPVAPSPGAQDDATGEQLWQWTTDLLKNA